MPKHRSDGELKSVACGRLKAPGRVAGSTSARLDAAARHRHRQADQTEIALDFQHSRRGAPKGAVSKDVPRGSRGTLALRDGLFEPSSG
jgi:hypothetical protein